MGKFFCECGNVLSDIMFPCRHEGFLVTETFAADDFDGLVEKFEGSYFCCLLDNARQVMECNECGRVHIESKAGANYYISYMAEDKKYHKIIDTNVDIKEPA